MKATGIVRKIDDLGRVVIPKEIRRVLRIRENDSLEIYTDDGGKVILKKYSPVLELGQFADEYAETASSVTGCTVIISDTDHIIAVSGGRKKDLLGKAIDNELDKIIQTKSKYISNRKIIIPIVSNGDPIGSIMIISKEETRALGEMETLTAEIGARFLAKQIDN